VTRDAHYIDLNPGGAAPHRAQLLLHCEA